MSESSSVWGLAAPLAIGLVFRPSAAGIECIPLQ
jgi:hypothetical protein